MFGRFLDFVEIKTKITSLFAFLMTSGTLLSWKQPVDWTRTAIFFASMFLFDLTTTAINNYIDTATNGLPLPVKRSKGRAIMISLLILSIATGLGLVFLTDIVVLLAGGLCFLVGIFYTFGPIPISRMPLGEILSGLFYGLLIPFLLLYINMPAGELLSLSLGFDQIGLTLQVAPMAALLLLSVIPVCLTANIMLANNICDVERDVKVKRFTLPYYIGDRAVTLYAVLFYLTYVADIALVAFRILPPVVLAALLTFPIVRRNILQFRAKQEKSTTFMTSIKNYLLIMGANTILIYAGVLIG